jgi:hypothetical protein
MSTEKHLVNFFRSMCEWIINMWIFTDGQDP